MTTDKILGLNSKPLICEVCEIEEAVGVACVPAIPVSAAYCRTCLDKGADPWKYVRLTIICCGGANNVVPEILEGLTYYNNKYMTINEALLLDPITQEELDMSPPLEEPNDEDSSHIG